MTWLFWLDVVAYGVSGTIAIALTLMLLGAGVRRVALNRSFALFTLMAAAWATLAMLLRLALWLQRGNPALLGELAALTFILLGPSLFLFTTHYVGLRTRWTDLAVVLGIAASVFASFPLFNHQLVLNHYLDPDGTTHHQLSLLGGAFSVVPSLYVVWSLVLSWQGCRRTGKPYLAVSVLFLAIGLVIGGILDVPFPVISLAACLGVATLGYAVVGQQHFNPLQGRTAELQREIAERMRVEAALQESQTNLQTLFDSLDDFLFVLDLKGRILQVNALVTERLGYSRDELLGQSVLQVHAADRQSEAAAIVADMVAGKADVCLVPLQTRGGDRIPVETKVTRGRWSGEDVLFGISRDITGRVRADEVLRVQGETEREFSQRLATLHEVSLKLSLTGSLDDLCRLAVELGYDLLGFDRIGIWFVDQGDPEYILGTFGIDENGELRDERGSRDRIGPDTAGAELLAGKAPLAYRADEDLYNDRSQLKGHGEKVTAGLWDGERIVGLTFADNLMTGRPITKYQCDLLVLFAQMVGHLSTLKRAQEALSESEELLRLIFENAFDGISLYEEFPESETRMLVDCNARYAEIAGRSREELLEIGDTLPIQRGTGGDVSREEFVRALREAGVRRGTFSWSRPDGKGNTVEYAAVPVKMENRVLTVGIDRDITERKRTEAQILRLQHLLQNITDSMPSVLITLDPDGRVLTWNPAAEDLTGQSVAQVEGRPLWKVCPELDRYRDLFEQVLRERQGAQRHRERLVTGGESVYRDVDVFPLTTNDVEGVVLRIDDVTRRVQLEEMMLQSAKMASVGTLAAGVAHEINNPLGAMMQSAQVLQMALNTQRPRTRKHLQMCGVDPEGLECYLQERQLIEYLDGIRATGGRAAKIVSDLLSFSRRSSSKTAPRDLNALVEQTLDLASADYDLKRRYDFRSIAIVRELAPDLPDVICDGQQIQQVVLNLVRNAAQAMAREMRKKGSDGEYRPRLMVRTAYREVEGRGWVRLAVEDNGPGIPEAMRARLFEPFLTTKDVGEGTGLGLWLCWSVVVERHRGRIWVEPVEVGGSRFVLELPIT